MNQIPSSDWLHERAKANAIITEQTFAVNDKKNKIDDEHCLTNIRLGLNTVYGWITYKKAKKTIRQVVMEARK